MPPLHSRDILPLDRRGLLRALCAGHAIDPSALDDTEYRGIALGLPAWVERLSWKTFQKTFHRDPTTGALRGWNVRLEQRGVEASSVPLQNGDGTPRTFGHYVVVPAAGRPMPARCSQGLLIDYALGDNAFFDPMRPMRDPLVAINAGSAELILGWSYVELGPLRIGTPSFFLLERERTLSHIAHPRRASPTRLLPPARS